MEFSGLDPLLSQLGEVASVAVVCRKGHSQIADRLRSASPATVTTHCAELEDAGLHLGLAASGPFDLVVDDVGGRSSRRRMGRLLMHCRDRGRLVIKRTDHDILPWLLALVRLRDSGDLAPPSLLATRDRTRNATDTRSLRPSVGSR